MGLDNCFKATVQSPQEIVFPEGLSLCGGMFSGHGSDGSFRGKVYTEFFDSVCGVSLYSDQSPEDVGEIAHRLEVVATEHAGQAWDNPGGWQPDVPSQELSYYGVTAHEVRDFVALFKAASEQNMKLVAWY